MFVYMTANDLDTDISIAGVFNDLRCIQELPAPMDKETAE